MMKKDISFALFVLTIRSFRLGLKKIVFWKMWPSNKRNYFVEHERFSAGFVLSVSQYKL